jgi:hypothetical protein
VLRPADFSAGLPQKGLGGEQIEDFGFCDAFAAAVAVRDGVIRPLLHRAVGRKDSKVPWRRSLGIEDGPPEADGLFEIVATADTGGMPSGRSEFRITAKVTVPCEGDQLHHLVLCEHVNANPTALEKSETLCRNAWSTPARADLSSIRTTYSQFIQACFARAEHRRDEREF